MQPGVRRKRERGFRTAQARCLRAQLAEGAVDLQQHDVLNRCLQYLLLVCKSSMNTPVREATTSACLKAGEIRCRQQRHRRRNRWPCQVLRLQAAGLRLGQHQLEGHSGVGAVDGTALWGSNLPAGGAS